MNPGPGFGGSCFPKDTMAMSYMARKNEVEMTLINAVIEGNIKRKKEMAERILNTIKGIESPKIAILGLAFKDGTDDCRESPAMEIIGHLLKYNAKIKAYDPKAMDTAKQILGDNIEYATDMYDAINDADILVILTEWRDFKNLDLVKVANLMRTKNIIDLRHILDPVQVNQLEFNFKGL